MKHSPQPHVILVTLVISLTLLLSAFSPAMASGKGTVPIPKPLAPVSVITDTTPTYKWGAIAGADRYQYEVYKGTTRIINQLVMPSACTAAACNHTSPVVLTFTSHKWRVRAFDAGFWSDWSAFKYFTVSRPPVSFNSQFTASMTGWKALGSIPWYVSPTAMYTSGDEDDCANVYRTSSLAYKNFNYSARIKCTTTGYCENYLAVRMGTKVEGTENCWGPGYLFGYDDDGYVAIFKVINDKWDDIIYYTYDSVIKKSDWNILRVVATANTFKFYANGKLLYTIVDSSYKIGAVGILMWEYGTSKVQVDWADLKVLP